MRLSAAVFIIAAALACCGCMTHTSTRITPSSLPGSSTRSNDIGEKKADAVSVRVDVFADGHLEIYRTEVTRERLVRRLANEEHGDNKQRGVTMASQRAVVLRAHDGVGRDTLEDLRDFLVRNGVPNVILATARSVTSDVTPDALRK